MSEREINQDYMNEVYRNASVALLSISNVMPEIEDFNLKKEIADQYDGYEKLIGEMTSYMAEKGYEIKDVGTMKKMSMNAGIKMNTLFDDTKTHIAEIMIKGTVMGVTELCKILNEEEKIIDKNIVDFAKRLKALEELYEERLKKFL